MIHTLISCDMIAQCSRQQEKIFSGTNIRTKKNPILSKSLSQTEHKITVRSEQIRVFLETLCTYHMRMQVLKTKIVLHVPVKRRFLRLCNLGDSLF